MLEAKESLSFVVAFVGQVHPVIAVLHFNFVTIHPFADGVSSFAFLHCSFSFSFFFLFPHPWFVRVRKHVFFPSGSFIMAIIVSGNGGLQGY